MNKNFFLCLLLCLAGALSAQSGAIEGTVLDEATNEPIPFANVAIQGTTTGVSADFDGKFSLEGLEPDLYNLQISAVGYKTRQIFELLVSNNRPVYLDIALVEEVLELEDVVIQASPFNKTAESPVSLRTIGVSEIQRNPGGGRDISRVIQSLPGVSSTASFRNDILIRGGAPNENRFYLDGVEVPNINHFATQGSSGGPQGMINVDFLREVDLYAGAFPVNRGNTLSSVFDFKQRDGRKDRWGATFVVGSSDLAATFEGPMGENASILFSARQSYLQVLFELLELPFLPTYNDFQLKYKYKPNQQNEFTLVGLGAIDRFDLNLEQNDTEENRYILGNLPENSQWNYTLGGVWKRYLSKGYFTTVLSRNMLNNEAFKYLNNDRSSEDNLLLRYGSQEIENKLRTEYTRTADGYRLNGGINYEFAKYNNRTFNIIRTQFAEDTVDYFAEFNMQKYGLFANVSKAYAGERLTLSLGFRMDGNGYSSAMANPLEQFSPRFSLAYSLNPEWSLNFNAGRYFQLPAYTVLGFQDNAGNFTNKDNGIKYIRADHLVAGMEWNTSTNSKLTVEGFYKRYNDYPFLLRDSIALANLGGDFGVVGNEPAVPEGEGRAYGVEFLAQQKLYKGFFGILAYTFVISEFKDKNGVYIPSSWDNRNIVSLTAGKKFSKNWELGLVWRYSGGLPYTPYDASVSALKSSWDVNRQGIFDFDNINSLRLEPVHALDMRVDKKWFFKKWSFNLFVDIENVYGFETTFQPFLNVVEDENGNPVEDPDDPTRYLLKNLDNISGTVLPTLGIIVII